MKLEARTGFDQRREPLLWGIGQSVMAQLGRGVEIVQAVTAQFEGLPNPSFNSIEFDGIKTQGGLNSFSLAAKRWIQSTNAIEIVSKYKNSLTTKGREVLKHGGKDE